MLLVPRWRNWIARQTSNLKVVGLSPTRGIFFVGSPTVFFDFVFSSYWRRMSLWPNWIRRLTTNQKIGGSSPSRDTFLVFESDNSHEGCSPTVTFNQRLSMEPASPYVRAIGLVVWFSFRVGEVVGSIPTWPLFIRLWVPYISYFNYDCCFLNFKT